MILTQLFAIGNTITATTTSDVQPRKTYLKKSILCLPSFYDKEYRLMHYTFNKELDKKKKIISQKRGTKKERSMRMKSYKQPEQLTRFLEKYKPLCATIIQSNVRGYLMRNESRTKFTKMVMSDYYASFGGYDIRAMIVGYLSPGDILSFKEINQACNDTIKEMQRMELLPLYILPSYKHVVATESLFKHYISRGCAEHFKLAYIAGLWFEFPNNCDYIEDITEAGNIYAFRWVLWKSGRNFDIWNAFAQGAIIYGQLEMLKIIYARGYLSKGKDYIDWAAFYGHSKILFWLRSKGYEWSEETCNSAAEVGHLELLKSLISRGCPFNQLKTRITAVECGQVEVLKFVHYYKRSPCTTRWDQETLGGAASYRQLETAKWALANGCPWSENTVEYALQCCYFDFFKWAVTNGCPYDNEEVILSLPEEDDFRDDMLEWLRSRENIEVDVEVEV